MHYTRQGNATVFENTFKSKLNYYVILNTQYPDSVQTSRKYCTLGPCSSTVQFQAHARVRLKNCSHHIKITQPQWVEVCLPLMETRISRRALHVKKQVGCRRRLTAIFERCNASSSSGQTLWGQIREKGREQKQQAEVSSPKNKIKVCISWPCFKKNFTTSCHQMFLHSRCK